MFAVENMEEKRQGAFDGNGYKKQIVYKNLNEIRPYEKNPRKNDNAVEYVANSIKQFNFQQPIVIDKNGVIVAGHTRYKASKKLGLEKVPCIIADDLTDEQIKAYRLVDNKVSEKSEWDFDLLFDELSEILDVDMEMFDFAKSVDATFIDDLYDEMVGDHEVNTDIFSITFNFDKKYETQIQDYIKENGKEKIVNHILEVIGIA